MQSCGAVSRRAEYNCVVLDGIRDLHQLVVSGACQRLLLESVGRLQSDGPGFNAKSHQSSGIR